MKLNNKGFAISTVIYMILIMAVVLITLTLSILSARKLILDKIRKETFNNIYNIYDITYRQALNILKQEAIDYGTNNSITKESIKIEDLNSSIDEEILDGYDLSEKYLTINLNNGSYDVYFGKAETITNISTNLNKFIDIVDYKVYGNSKQDTYSGKNLLNLYDRIEGTLIGSSNSTKRDFDYNKYYIGLSANNYYNPSGKINSAYLEGNEWHINSDGVYGIAFPVKVTPNTTYSISGESLRIVSNNIYYNIGIGFYDSEGNLLSYTQSVRYLTFTTPENCYTATLILKPDGENIDTIHKNVQIEFGNQSTSYTKYVGGIDAPNPYYPQDIKSVGDLVTDSQDENYGKYKIPITASSPNLLVYPYETGSRKSGGIDIKVNSDGSITFDGTSTGFNVRFQTFRLKAGTYSISGNNTSELNLWLRKVGSTSSSGYVRSYSGNKGTITLSQDTDMYVYVTINSGTTVDNVTIYPMVNEGNIALPYSKYIQPITETIYIEEPLRKIGNYSDYIDFESGKVIRKIKQLTFNGSEEWNSYNNVENDYYTSIQNNKSLNGKSDILSISNSYKPISFSKTILSQNDYAVTISETGNNLHIKNKDYNDVNSFKSYLLNKYSNIPVVVDYVMETPTEELITLPNNISYGEYTNISIDTETKPINVEFTVIEKIRQL